MSAAPILALWLAGGAVLGVIYFRLVRFSADLLLSDRRGAPVAGVALVLVRLAVLAGVLVLAALQGAGPLLAAGLGLLAGRWWTMRRALAEGI
ncbi:ATP synthase subunit I [Rhodobaculum claviforme]|uniref:N-ATPase, AtpR subunit n=1 Tax=Rhodobaculum claviforme TaxID=1549854 RepID=A0A934TN44_9RHOB|nr:ATP synthase subunit I [Rhodobaculum claviforme]MBK5928718.1 hypothetical protein [Rhodobaculum claviforme]